ncbi:hypothetical protein chiPu_0024631 [Chiloscyllium punctatum]|uniref:Uncharacterized protein n=1 Tax=Chiloscyllium punctatum TaxID=137246 RepID=A0A401TDX1_CHIPU|nr:hypothetical protein [Chiloscyllium punctatum]
MRRNGPRLTVISAKLLATFSLKSSLPVENPGLTGFHDEFGPTAEYKGIGSSIRTALRSLTKTPSLSQSNPTQANGNDQAPVPHPPFLTILGMLSLGF